MNKMKASDRSKSTRRPQNIRIIYKKRTNHKQTYQPQQKKDNKSSIQSSRLTPLQSDQQSIEEVRSFVRNKLKTQYSCNYQPRPSFKPDRNHSFYHKQDKEQNYLPQSTKTLGCIGYESYNPEKTVKTQNDSMSVRNHLKMRQEGKESYDKIDRDLDSSVQKRLKTWLDHNEHIDFGNQKDVNELIQQYKTINDDDSNAEEVKEGVQYSDRKINLLERMLASKTVESEILKKHFFSQISKPKYSSHKRSISLFPMATPTKGSHNIVRQRQSLVKMSTNRTAFQKPNKQAYKLEKGGRGFFHNDRHKQPLPRSSYSRDFLNYRGLTPFPSSKPADNQISSNLSGNQMSSSYRRQFVGKNTDLVDHRELDAYRNKIKNLPISFGKRQKEQVFAKLAHYIHEKKKKTVDGYIQVPFLKSSLLSESRRQYGTGAGKAAKIKHENANKIKYQLKNKFHV